VLSRLLHTFVFSTLRFSRTNGKMAAAFFSKLPSIAYPPEQHGRWSPVTSTLDWCEEVSGLEMFVDVTLTLS
jgi:hypothetical protein